MEEKKLNGRRIAILATNGGKIKSWSKGNWGSTCEVDFSVEDADPLDFYALVPEGAQKSAATETRSW